MAEWKPFDLKWGRSIWYCSACEESTEVPTYLGTPMYNFCPMCGANMNMKSENKQADTPQTMYYPQVDGITPSVIEPQTTSTPYKVDTSSICKDDKDTNVLNKSQTDCETCKNGSLTWDSAVCDSCSKAHSNYEPQTEDYDFRDEQEYNDRWNTDCGWK